MASFHRNGVMTGILDLFCLLCEIHLKGEDEVRSHIVEHGHKTSLESWNYVEKYKDDSIRKVKQGYYCECCNGLLGSFMLVQVHVSKVQHQKNKDIKLLRRQGNVVVAFNKIAFEDDAWHGLLDGSCVVCNTEYNDKEEHKTCPQHLLKLTQSSVEFDNGSVYRKADNYFHCVVCNALFSMDDFKTHSENADHIKYYKDCNKSYQNLQTKSHHLNKVDEDGNRTASGASYDEKDVEEIQKAKEIQIKAAELNAITSIQASKAPAANASCDEKDVNEILKTEDPDKIISIQDSKVQLANASCDEKDVNEILKTEDPDKIISIQDSKAQLANASYDEKDVNEILKTAEPDKIISIQDSKSTSVKNRPDKEISDTPKTSQNSDESGNRNLKHNNNSAAVSVTINDQKALNKAKRFAEANQLTFNEGTNSSFCSTCNITITSSLERMKEHISEEVHKKKSEIIAKILSDVISTDDYICVSVQMSPLFQFVRHLTRYAVINFNLCLEFLSYTLMIAVGSQIRCQICEININNDLAMLHFESMNHTEKFGKIPVLCAFTSEFVREVRPGLYHCGFCNIIQGSFKGLNDHLKSVSHRINKSDAERRLQIFLPDVRRHFGRSLERICTEELYNKGVRRA